MDTVVSLLGQPKGKNICAFLHLCKLPFGHLLPSLCLSIIVTKCKGKASLVVPNYISELYLKFLLMWRWDPVIWKLFIFLLNVEAQIG